MHLGRPYFNFFLLMHCLIFFVPLKTAIKPCGLFLRFVQGGGRLDGAALQGDNFWRSEASLRWKEEFVHSQPIARGTSGGEQKYVMQMFFSLVF